MKIMAQAAAAAAAAAVYHVKHTNIFLSLYNVKLLSAPGSCSKSFIVFTYCFLLRTISLPYFSILLVQQAVFYASTTNRCQRHCFGVVRHASIRACIPKTLLAWYLTSQQMNFTKLCLTVYSWGQRLGFEGQGVKVKVATMTSGPHISWTAWRITTKFEYETEYGQGPKVKVRPRSHAEIRYHDNSGMGWRILTK